MTRTFEEIRKAYQERTTSEYAKVRTSLTGEDLATIFYHIAELEAANAALQAQVGAFEDLHSPDESPPLDYANDEAKYFRFEAYEKVEALVRMPLVKQMHFGKDKKEGLVETAWQGGNSPFFGYRIPHEQVIGWRPLPDESPTAAESEA